MTTARYRGAYPDEIKPGACLWAPAGIFGVDDLDYRVNGGLRLVRVLAQDALGKWVARCRPPAAREVRALDAKDLWVQLGAKGDPSQPTEVQESPDKPPTPTPAAALHAPFPPTTSAPTPAPMPARATVATIPARAAH